MRLKSVKEYAMFRSWCFCTVRTIAQFGSALDWGSRGRGFKSRWSDQESPSFQRFHSIGAMGFSLCGAIGAINAFDRHDSVDFLKSERTALYSADVQPHSSNHRFLLHPRRRSLVVILCKRRRPHPPRRMGPSSFYLPSLLDSMVAGRSTRR